MTTTDVARPEIRRPAQKRSRARFEAILDGAERLLDTLSPSAISIHAIAAEVGISPPSIYHFFPEPQLVFSALAERYLKHFEEGVLTEVPDDVESWQDFQTLQYRAGRNWFNAHPAARQVLLGGPAWSSDIRMQDLDSNFVMAGHSIAVMTQKFIMPEIPDLHDRLVEVIVINDAIWSLSIHRHGLITDAMEEQARRARIAYSRTFLPEYLPLRADPEYLPLRADKAAS
ncbi:AcrR family transcriptional regulator [Sphingopyxis panaciterrae]|uniref:TetR/AcrR family transcriptional regulator n=1 Tax=Sphingopyxis panaciterrae TaxID=363841 RepID=UPI00141DF86E|nr:TetR/AcrR family transcriptional regulator [Sphingopyxis panaciterrae]NIJ39706.1 AcrR family transcriptional regulator [Sphingopyxis panaciterrae]